MLRLRNTRNLSTSRLRRLFHSSPSAHTGGQRSHLRCARESCLKPWLHRDESECDPPCQTLGITMPAAPELDEPMQNQLIETFYAHTREGQDESTWERLEDHLQAVAVRAQEFTEGFGAGSWGRVAGLWHDLGKFRPEFQARLRGDRTQVEHAGAGAALAMAKHDSRGLPIAFAVAGHHSGLANLKNQGDSDRTPLLTRVDSNRPVLNDLSEVVPAAISQIDLPELPTWLACLRDGEARLSAEMFVRFLFSAVVDADRLCTEHFLEPGKRSAVAYDRLATLSRRLDDEIERVAARANPASRVNQARANVLLACQTAAERAQGMFSLTVPTGGGKTLSAMSFALRHAVHHDLRRVIVVIPYTSIIEQNAKAYATALGANNVIEHHSNLDEAKAYEQSPEIEQRRRLAAENWDAPVVVTTTVQFFESLFSAHPSRCRKLHNVANSVIVLDEVQTLPPSLLLPILDGLQELAHHYGCSVVLSTATPPALSQPDLSFGLAGVREIVPNPTSLAAELKRVTVTWPQAREVVSYATVADLMAGRPRVLAIVHLRKDARYLAELLPPDGRYHLSALMCPAHRLEVLTAVKKALDAGDVCRVVSTQLVEAGVDIDFPVVYRALAGLDSLAQAAGRCNREGSLTDWNGQPAPGQFIVFRAETKPPPGVLRMALDGTEGLLAAHGDRLDLLAPSTFTEFFRGLYFRSDVDAAGVQTKRRDFNFADVERAFRMIEDYTIPVVVPHGDAVQRLERYRHSPTRTSRRALQPYIVQIAPWHLQTLSDVGAIEQIDDAVTTLTQPFDSLYDRVFGLRINTDVDTSSAWVV